MLDIGDVMSCVCYIILCHCEYICQRNQKLIFAGEWRMADAYNSNWRFYFTATAPLSILSDICISCIPFHAILPWWWTPKRVFCITCIVYSRFSPLKRMCSVCDAQVNQMNVCPHRRQQRFRTRIPLAIATICVPLNHCCFAFWCRCVYDIRPRWTAKRQWHTP